MQADQEKITRLLKTARGQIDGLLRMVEDDRYCIDISNQLLAAQAILRNANRQVLRAHLACCVETSMQNDDGRKKIEEIMDIIDKLSK